MNIHKRFWVVILALSVGWMLISMLSTLRQTRTTPAVLASRNVHFAVADDAPDPNRIFALVNSQRTVAGEPALIAEDRLADIARQRLEDMRIHHYYAHQSPAGQYYYDLMKQHSIIVSYSCENLDLSSNLQPDDYVEDWLRSPEHHACLMNHEVRYAGYAAGRVDSPTGEPSFIVVAIHSTTPL
jgi:uncharacterized protein YkwD